MNVFKVFTEKDAIKRALEKILEYPYDERPLIHIKFEVGFDLCYIEGTLFDIDYERNWIIIGTSRLKGIELDSITKLYIFDIKVE